MTVWSFGDSWGAGWGLENPSQDCVGNIVAKHLSKNHIQKSKAGSSLGQIMYNLQSNSCDFKQNDLILVIVPPDIRWYTEDSRSIISIHQSHKEWQKFIKNKTALWFQYHHSLFLYTIYCICREYRCNLIMAHNYGSLEIIKTFERLIPESAFLDKDKSLTELLQGNDWHHNYGMKFDGPPKPFEGQYFIENDTHPNAKGHKKIADILIEKYDALSK